MATELSNLKQETADDVRLRDACWKLTSYFIFIFIQLLFDFERDSFHQIFRSSVSGFYDSKEVFCRVNSKVETSLDSSVCSPDFGYTSGHSRLIKERVHSLECWLCRFYFNSCAVSITWPQDSHAGGGSEFITAKIFGCQWRGKFVVFALT